MFRPGAPRVTVHSSDALSVLSASGNMKPDNSQLPQASQELCFALMYRETTGADEARENVHTQTALCVGGAGALI